MFIFLFKNTTKYVILLDVIVKGIVFLIPFWDNSLSSYRNATDFFNIYLYPEILLISSNTLVVESLGFSIYEIMS